MKAISKGKRQEGWRIKGEGHPRAPKLNLFFPLSEHGTNSIIEHAIEISRRTILLEWGFLTEPVETGAYSHVFVTIEFEDGLTSNIFEIKNYAMARHHKEGSI